MKTAQDKKELVIAEHIVRHVNLWHYYDLMEHYELTEFAIKFVYLAISREHIAPDLLPRFINKGSSLKKTLKAMKNRLGILILDGDTIHTELTSSDYFSKGVSYKQYTIHISISDLVREFWRDIKTENLDFRYAKFEKEFAQYYIERLNFTISKLSHLMGKHVSYNKSYAYNLADENYLDRLLHNIDIYSSIDVSEPDEAKNFCLQYEYLKDYYFDSYVADRKLRLSFFDLTDKVKIVFNASLQDAINYIVPKIAEALHISDILQSKGIILIGGTKIPFSKWIDTTFNLYMSNAVAVIHHIYSTKETDSGYAIVIDPREMIGQMLETKYPSFKNSYCDLISSLIHEFRHMLVSEWNPDLVNKVTPENAYELMEDLAKSLPVDLKDIIEDSKRRASLACYDKEEFSDEFDACFVESFTLLTYMNKEDSKGNNFNINHFDLSDINEKLFNIYPSINDILDLKVIPGFNASWHGPLSEKYNSLMDGLTEGWIEISQKTTFNLRNIEKLRKRIRKENGSWK